jgi:hypothetical protein
LTEIPNQCLVRHVLVCPSEIHFLRFILEAYEGIAVVTPLAPRLGLVRLSIAPGCEDDVDKILSWEKERLQTEDVTLEGKPFSPAAPPEKEVRPCPHGNFTTNDGPANPLVLRTANGKSLALAPRNG